MNLTPLEPWAARKIAQPRLERAALERYQLEKLQATLNLARAHSAFYRRRLAGAPDQLASLADVASLPFTTAADLRANPLQFLCVSQGAIRRVVTLDTSGTSGPPKRLYFTHADQQSTLDFFQAGMSTFTRPGDRVLILLPCQRPDSVGDLLASAVRQMGAEPIPHGPPHNLAATLKTAINEHVAVVVGLPVHVLRLALAAPPGSTPPRVRSALLTADHVPQAILRRVEQAWGCTVYNHYGMTEMGLGGGVDCAARRGYHLREADLYFEIVDPVDGAPLPEGQEGELVFTTLTRQGMPLIRYRTGDLARWLPGPCPCGTALKTLAHISTRCAGRASLGGALLTQAALDEALFAVPGLLDFGAALHACDGVYQLELQVQTQAEAKATFTQVLAALAAIPALHAADAQGKLAAPTVAVSDKPLPPTHSGKRSIRIDLEGPG